jgi:hypothetical protein
LAHQGTNAVNPFAQLRVGAADLAVHDAGSGAEDRSGSLDRIVHRVHATTVVSGA